MKYQEDLTSITNEELISDPFQTSSIRNEEYWRLLIQDSIPDAETERKIRQSMNSNIGMELIIEMSEIKWQKIILIFLVTILFSTLVVKTKIFPHIFPPLKFPSAQVSCNMYDNLYDDRLLEMDLETCDLD
jgi:hypothetical protein